MTFKEKFYFRDGRTLEIGGIEKKVVIEDIKGILHIYGPIDYVINLNQVLWIEITEEKNE